MVVECLVPRNHLQFKITHEKTLSKVILCLENLAVMLAEQNLNFDIQAKHLYHDREEITVHIALKP